MQERAAPSKHAAVTVVLLVGLTSREIHHDFTYSLPSRSADPHWRRLWGVGVGYLAPGEGRRRFGRASRSAGAAVAALCAQGQAADLPVHERRAQSRRYLRPQAGTQSTRWSSGPRLASGQDQAQAQGQADGFAFQDTAFRQERHRGERVVSRSRPLHGRPLHSARHVYGQSQSRARLAPHEHGEHAADSPKYGFLVDLRAGFGKSEPSRLCSAVPG